MTVGRLLQICGANIFRQHRRNASILSSLEYSPVLVSSNKDVYTNLALEHWLYTNLKFEDNNTKEGESKLKVFEKPVVLIWTDDPCVVLGRHQNPWVESTVGFVQKAGLKLARRHSGGGCVFHDENNINISIIGHRKNFENRQENLRFLARVLKDKYGLKCEPTQRHDLIHSDSGHKISGSAAKLGRYNCYHHFTLLVDTSKDVLYTAIRQKQQDFIKTNSTTSARNTVINLRDLKADLEVEQVISDLANEYGKLYGTPTTDRKPPSTLIEGDGADYVTLNVYREELQSWDWIYGMTPKFKLERCYNHLDHGVGKQIRFTVFVNKGFFEKIEIDCSSAEDPSQAFKYLIGTKFNYKEAMVNVSKLLQFEEDNLTNLSIGTTQILATYLLQMIHESNY